MKIDWKARLKNKAFWVSMASALCVLVQVVLAPFGIKWDYNTLLGQIGGIINAVFALLIPLGIIVDTSTPTLSDKPKESVTILQTVNGD